LIVVFGAIVIVAVDSCCNLPIFSDILSYSVEIGSNRKGPTYAPTYVNWKSEKEFNDALARIRKQNHKGASYCFCVIKNPKDHPIKYKFNDKCTDYTCPLEDIRTVKVTKSKAADKIAAGESVANDPNVMHKVQSPDPGDIITVLSTLKPAGP